VTLEVNSPLLLGRCSHQLRKSCAGASMMYAQAESVFILERYFTPMSFVAARETSSNACPDKEVRVRQKIHGLATTFRYTVSVCLRHVLIDRQNS
jgi:hypothetical protein